MCQMIYLKYKISQSLLWYWGIGTPFLNHSGDDGGFSPFTEYISHENLAFLLTGKTRDSRTFPRLKNGFAEKIDH